MKAVIMSSTTFMVAVTQTYRPDTRQQVWSDVVRVMGVGKNERTLAKYGKVDISRYH